MAGDKKNDSKDQKNEGGELNSQAVPAATDAKESEGSVVAYDLQNAHFNHESFASNGRLVGIPARESKRISQEDFVLLESEIDKRAHILVTPVTGETLAAEKAEREAAEKKLREEAIAAEKAAKKATKS